ncbi:MAG: hypothetical protein RR473_03210 [Comamonas sp.]|uniref:hypothetical protein n=1 Tax=unclassified Comamonas TaxID=2638500 RepID=UPI000EACC6DF|nr:hypothetical protein [Comamonas sp. lk]
MHTEFTPNLDKLRNIVQRFAPHSFTTEQVVAEYQDSPANSESRQLFDELLARHAVVLGIQAVPGAAQGQAVWKPA